MRQFTFEDDPWDDFWPDDINDYDYGFEYDYEVEPE